MKKEQPTREEILTSIVVNHIDDLEFLERVNKLTFGLLSKSKFRND